MTGNDMEQTRLAFDRAAAVYDAEYENLPGIRKIRAVTSRFYLKYFPPDSNLLEINCGTGNDALFLARHQRHVLATDLSPRMLEEVDAKVSRAGLTGLITTRRCSFDQLGTLQGLTFDGAFSNLGGLNCTDRMHAVASALAPLVKPGGFFLATVMPPFCLWETLASLSRFRWRDAFRRMSSGGTLAHVHGGLVRTHYHSPRAFSRAFGMYFESVLTLGLLVLLPPPNSERAYARLGPRARLLEGLDDKVAGLPLFRAMGDHYLMVLRRNSRR